ncbi:ABC transporter ATP-binding protein [Latilactobacillus curvatus]|uniref:ABC transporter ATP-binding protein n=1 Tax=Latilactobacillus curvatus TaxID=28038 RepID=UPI002410EEC5|nr:ABC transporter ATP-binding protein [Latilactobacillus curvatus]MDG2978727.1 ABC transporter ATP-binding protein [Latilactobacillus curvatus]
MTLLTATGITKKFGQQTAVDQIDLQVAAGQLIAFLGPNGAGKSTTINMLTGTIPPTTGQIKVGDLTPQDRQYQHQLGVVFQKSVLDGQLTVWQNLNSRAQMSGQQDFKQDNPLIVAFGLSAILNQRYQTLSGGQRRRVDIARALIHHPAILFLDEPSTGLDIQTRTIIWQTLERLRQAHGLTIILTTHYLEEAEAADFVYVIDHGHIIAADTVSRLKSQYAQNQLMIETPHPKVVLEQAQPDWRVIEGQHSVQLAVDDEQAAIAFLHQIQSLVTHFEFRQGTMDDIFMALTGKEIR